MKKSVKATVWLASAVGSLFLAATSGLHFERAGLAATPQAANAMVPINLAIGKKATASSQQSEDLGPDLTVDGDGGSRWCAADGSVPQWLSVDLGKPEDLSGCRITWEHAQDAYDRKIEGSPDGKSWNTLSVRAFGDPGSPAELVKFDAKGVRFLRVTISGTRPGSWASVCELEILGTQLVPADSVKKIVVSSGTKASAVKAPAGWDVKIFGQPPEVHYCTTISAALNGDVYVGVDEQGSLGREKGRGRVVRLRDTKGTGIADDLLTVAKMDNPRGVWIDGNELYVLHPPFLTRYTLGKDGTSEKSEDLVTGITVLESLNSRGADHTTNGFRVGVDGWIYIAMGDFGAMKATGKDGTELLKHGGGVVRVRTDGTGLEAYSRGQRNIYDVAIDPFMHVFTRDNTNDGDGWNDRLSYIIPDGNYGYPSLFVHFPGEFVDCLVDYGGGSPCGSLWVDEPNLPALTTGLMTVEWGVGKVFHHPLVAKGAGYETPVKQEVFLDTDHPTDLDYGGNGHFYLASWANGGFAWSGPNVGFVAQVTPKNFKAAPIPDIAASTDAELITHLGSPSMKLREAAQREIIRRGDKPVFDDGLEKLAAGAGPLQGRAAAIFTLKTLRGEKSNAALAALTKLPEIREFALRALADKKGDATAALPPFLDGLKDPDPHVRLIAAWGIGRLGRAEGVTALLPLAGDDDFLVQHTAVNSLVELKAISACLAAIDPTHPKLSTGVLRALQQMHDVQVVDGLAAKLKELTDPAVRAEVYAALCRLHYTEAEWNGSWWGTRPDTSGPYFKTASWEATSKVHALLESALKTEEPDMVRQLVTSMRMNKIDSPAVKEYIAKAAATDPKFRVMLIDELASANKPPTADQVSLLKGVALDAKVEPPIRIKAIRVLEKDPNDAVSLDASTDALAGLIGVVNLDGDLAGLLDESIRDAKYAGAIPYFTKMAATSEAPAKRELAYSVLVSLANSRLTKAPAKAAAAKAIEAGWEGQTTVASLLRAVGRNKATEYRDRVESMAKDKNAEVASAAAYASDRLGIKPGDPGADGRELIEKAGYDKTVQLVLKEKGDPTRGKELFSKIGCVACHTVSPSEPPKGPFLGGIATRYSRSDLCESIMKPSAKIAQGFETQWFRDKNGDVVEGFVTREGGDDLELRNATGVAQVLKKADIVKRGKREISIMPEGLLLRQTPSDLANVIAYLETLKAK